MQKEIERASGRVLTDVVYFDIGPECVVRRGLTGIIIVGDLEREEHKYTMLLKCPHYLFYTLTGRPLHCYCIPNGTLFPT